MENFHWRCAMAAKTDSFFRLTAADLMIREVVTIPADLPLRKAAQLLSRTQISGAPVVDSQGKCVGVLSATDFLCWAEKQGGITLCASSQLPRTCSFWVRQRDALGREVTLCTLAPGSCSLQVAHKTEESKELLACREPHSVPTDWQVVQTDELTAEPVRDYMTTDVVTVAPEASIHDVARMMLNAHIHRLIVVDKEFRPVGVISSTDILAAVAHHGGVSKPSLASFRSHAVNTGIVSSSPLPRLAHWSARVTSLLLLGLVIVIVIGHGGPPNIFRQPTPVQLEFAAMAIMLLGLVIGWVRELLGGLLVLLGLAAFNVVELSVNGRPALGAFPLFAVPGALFLLSALLRRKGK
jgi:CBS domain-containing protein